MTVELTFRRPQAAEQQRSASRVRDSASARQWLALQGPLIGVESLVRVAELVGEVMASESAADVRYGILEVLRGVVASRFIERISGEDLVQLPMAATDFDEPFALIDCALDLRQAYEALAARLPASAVLGQDAPRATAVMALHRALDLSALVLSYYQRTKVAIPERLWEQHARLGQVVRQLNCQNVELVADQNVTFTATCRQAFVVPVLIALADPTTLSAGEFRVVTTAVLRWSAKVGFRIDPIEPADASLKIPGNPGPVVPLASGTLLLRLDTRQLLESLARRKEALDEGRSLRSVGLGEFLGSIGLREMLSVLMRRWGAVMPDSLEFPSFSWRDSALEFALAVPGARPRDVAHSRVSSTIAYDYVRLKDDAVEHAGKTDDTTQTDKLINEAETWSVVGETADSLLAVRRHGRPRLNLGSLIGVKLGGKASKVPFLLGVVEGIQQGVSEAEDRQARPASTHLIRLRFLSGVPKHLRITADQSELSPGFVLFPAADDLTAPVWDRLRDMGSFSIVVPLATFRPERVLRFFADAEVGFVKCDRLIRRGLDFDHIAVTLN